MTSPILTIANQITILRMALAPLLAVLIVYREFTWALVVFVVAAVSDLLDGWIARLGHQKTTFGAMMDPMADKVLLSSCFVALTWGPNVEPRIPMWLTVTTLSRDLIILVSVAVVNLTLGRRMFYPSILGKLSTLSQILTAGVVLLENALGAESEYQRWLFVGTLALTIASALHYTYLASTGRTGTETS